MYVVRCKTDLKFDNNTTGDGIKSILRRRRLFCAFSSTKVWLFNALTVREQQQKKTFTGVLYNVQKNSMCINNVFVLTTCLFSTTKNQQKTMKRDQKRGRREVRGEYFLRD